VTTNILEIFRVKK